MSSSRVVDCGGCGSRNRVPAAATTGVPTCGRCHAALPWLADAGDGDFARVAEVSTVPVVVDLWAPWCGPCRRVSPALDRVAGDLAGRMKLVKVNVDEAPRTAARFSVRAVPTLLVLHEGREVSRQIGAPPGNTLRSWVAETVASASAGAGGSGQEGQSR